jgi:hypothetical protein
LVAGKLKPARGKPLPKKIAAGKCEERRETQTRSGLPAAGFDLAPPGAFWYRVTDYPHHHAAF